VGSAVCFGRHGGEQELDAELREFLDTAIEQKIRTGLSRETAVRAARMELGSVEAPRGYMMNTSPLPITSWRAKVERVSLRHNGGGEVWSPKRGALACGSEMRL